MLTPLAIAGGGLLIFLVRHLADTRRGVVGFVANALVVVGALAVGAVVIGALVAGGAALALIAAVCLFAIPLALLGGAVGNGSKGTYPRRYF